MHCRSSSKIEVSRMKQQQDTRLSKTQLNDCTERFMTTPVQDSLTLSKGEAVRCANFVRSRTPVSLALDGKTPLEVLTGTLPNLNQFRTFGCDAWVLIPLEKRSSKFSARSVKGTFTGYHNSSTYRVLVDDKIALSRNVSLVEDKFSTKSLNQSQTPDSTQVVPYLLREPPQFSQSCAASMDGS
eukprot:scaffold22_cov401-Pavlova_lutheri.AAC.3